MQLRTRREELATVTAGLVPVLLAGLVWSTGAVLEAAAAWTGLTGLLLLVSERAGKREAEGLAYRDDPWGAP